LDWKIGWLRALQDAINVRRRAPIYVGCINTVGCEAAAACERSERIDRWQQQFAA
jgi:hypothetical protein